MAAAAYRAGVELVDERTGELYDYTRKGGVVRAEVVVPHHGVTLTREDLWNAAENAEVRKDGRTAREWVIALPAELDEAQRIEVARDFTRWLVERYQVVGDLAIHKPARNGDDRNHHAHILLTTRKLTARGELLEKADIELDGPTLQKRGLPSSKKQIVECRKAWEQIANAALERHGKAARIDHRSHDDAGLDVVPTTHLGPTASQIERNGRRSERGELNRVAASLTAEIEDAAIELGDLQRIKIRRMANDKRDAALAAIRAKRQPERTSDQTIGWTVPLLKAALDAYGVARQAFEKLISWRGIAKKIEEWRLAHPAKARLRMMDGKLIELENEQKDLGEVDHDAERKLKLAEAELMRIKEEAEQSLEPPIPLGLSKKQGDDLSKIWRQTRGLSELQNEKQAVSNRPGNDSNGYSGPSL